MALDNDKVCLAEILSELKERTRPLVVDCQGSKPEDFCLYCEDGMFSDAANP